MFFYHARHLPTSANQWCCQGAWHWPTCFPGGGQTGGTDAPTPTFACGDPQPLLLVLAAVVWSTCGLPSQLLCGPRRSVRMERPQNMARIVSLRLNAQDRNSNTLSPTYDRPRRTPGSWLSGYDAMDSPMFLCPLVTPLPTGCRRSHPTIPQGRTAAPICDSCAVSSVCSIPRRPVVCGSDSNSRRPDRCASGSHRWGCAVEYSVKAVCKLPGLKAARVQGPPPASISALLGCSPPPGNCPPRKLSLTSVLSFPPGCCSSPVQDGSMPANFLEHCSDLNAVGRYLLMSSFVFFVFLNS